MRIERGGWPDCGLRLHMAQQPSPFVDVIRSTGGMFR